MTTILEETSTGSSKMSGLADLLVMKRMYSASKISEILGRSVRGLEMHLYNLPNLHPGGIISEILEEGVVKKMLAAVKRHHPEIHIATILNNGDMVNRFETEEAHYYRLYRGDADPELEFVYDNEAHERMIAAYNYLSDFAQKQGYSFTKEDEEKILRKPDNTSKLVS